MLELGPEAPCPNGILNTPAVGLVGRYCELSEMPFLFMKFSIFSDSTSRPRMRKALFFFPFNVRFCLFRITAFISEALKCLTFIPHFLIWSLYCLVLWITLIAPFSDHQRATHVPKNPCSALIVLITVWRGSFSLT